LPEPATELTAPVSDELVGALVEDGVAGVVVTEFTALLEPFAAPLDCRLSDAAACSPAGWFNASTATAATETPISSSRTPKASSNLRRVWVGGGMGHGDTG
jgi:Tfp pilus assembly protein FimV